MEKKTDKNGVVQYTNLQSGMYTATVQNQRTIINLKGKNHLIDLSIKLKPTGLTILGQTIPLPYLLICIIGILCILGFLLFTNRKRFKGKNKLTN